MPRVKQIKKEESKTILLIESDDFLADIYATKFRQEGFKVKRANDGEQGLKMLNREKPDCLLLDILLPKKDGFAVIKEIKANPDFRKMPIMVISNLGQKADIDKALDLGATDYFIKAHFVPSETVAKIKKLLKISASRSRP